jgi:hypothetical protein
MKRRRDWEQRLHAIIVAKRDLPHEFGKHDCLLWTADAVKAVTGKDFGKGHRSKYKSLASAYRHLQEMGFDSPEALLDSLFPVKPIGFAGRGDIALCRTPTGDNPGVVIGSDALVVGEQGETVGLVRVARKDWLKAWGVGDHFHSWPTS